MIAATGYKMLKVPRRYCSPAWRLPALGAGVFASFIVALLAIFWLLKFYRPQQL